MAFDRFLTYSLRHNRPVRVLMEDAGALRYVNLTVIALEDTAFAALRAGRKNPLVIPYERVLAVSYARGDDGDTLKNEQREAAPPAPDP